MTHLRSGVFVCVLSLAAVAANPARGADEYAVDPAHSGVNFKISHLALSWIQGRFDRFAGRFAVDPDNAANCSFQLTINVESIDTNNAKRDDHLRSPDFFNSKQFPAISFKSTSIQPAKDGYDVTGDLTLHGVTRPVTFYLTGGKTAEFPKGVRRTGFSTELSIKRSDFGMTKFAEALGDSVYVAISFEGVRK